MIKNQKAGLILVVIILSSALFFVACNKDGDFSPIPQIEVMGVARENNGFKDTAATVTIYFADGDGDLGVFDDGTQKENNFIISCFEKKNDVWNFLIDLSAPFPTITPTGSNKSIDGTIDYLMPLPPNVSNDTLRYELYIIDRAGNESNKVTTNEIVVSTL